MQSLRNLGVILLDRLRPSAWQRTLVMAGFVGVLGALATLGFRKGLFFIEQFLFGRSDGLVHIAAGLTWWERLASPALGGIVAGLILSQAKRLAGGGSGADYMEAIALGDGNLPARVSVLRALSSAASVTTGGAIGREGPMVQLAALTGSLIGRWRKAPIPRRRLMVACAAAAGVATAYNAPIAGALFVAEIVLRSLALETIGALIVAAVAANVVVVSTVGPEPLYRMPHFVLPGGGPTMLVLSALGIVAGLTAPMYLWVLDRGRDLFSAWRSPLWFKLGLGGLIVGGLSIVTPDVWGNGYSVVNSVLQGNWVWQMLLLVLLLKIVAVAASTGSGAVGGIFTPTLFVGAVAGALCATGLAAVWPGAPPASATAVVGMGAFLAACTHAPLMSVLMVFEMTENYATIVPSMLACVLGYSIARTLRPKSIYPTTPAAALPHAALAVAADFLRPEVATVPEGCTLLDVEQAFLRHRWQHLYVVDAKQHFVGAVSLHDVAASLRHPDIARQTLPSELLRRDYPRVQTDTPSWQVLEVFATHPGERLPVLEAGGRLVGHVTKTDVVMMFRDRLAAD